MTAVNETPSIKELEKILFGGEKSGNHVDEVWPDLFLGDMCVAHERFVLWKLRITHVLNAAHGKQHSLGCHEFYSPDVQYYGVPAEDSCSFNLCLYFQPCADYIHHILGSGGRLLVHCAVGVSRSASLVLAYLMIHQHFSLLDAIDRIKQKRWIFPNRGFLRQLRELDATLGHSPGKHRQK